MSLSPEQEAAVEACLSHKLVLITGPPGSGKTRLLEALANEREVLFVTPTATASDRVMQSTSKPARTAEHLLYYGIDHCPPLLIVDEAGMLSTDALQEIIRNVRPQRLVLVGDPDQLPCPNGYSALSTLLEHPRIPRVHLTKVFRRTTQDTALDQVLESMRMRQEVDLFLQDASFQITYKSSLRECYAHAATLYRERLSQILAFTRDAVDAANALTENTEAVLVKEGARVGDRVVCTKNQYEDQRVLVSNGTCGTLKPACVAYDNGFTDKGHASCFEPCRCMTVHKAQGNEYSVRGIVVLAPWKGGEPPLQLLYTALSRFKTEVIVIGTPQLVQQAFRAKFAKSVDPDLFLPSHML